MLVILGHAIIGVLIMLIEVPRLLRSNLRRELWIFVTLLFIALGFNITEVLGVTLHSPLEWMAKIYKPMSDAVYHYLK